MIKTFHEAPKSIFKKVQERTDGDYALVHLFEEDPEYLQLFKKAVEQGREVILDNSVFELEKPFDPERFLYWINELKPAYYIVPDVLEDAERTIKNMEDWIENYAPRVNCNSKIIGVVQGKSYTSIKECYLYMSFQKEVSKIGISFDYSYYEKLVPHKNKLVSWMLGRIALLGQFESQRVIDRAKPHHLLGCALPQEFQFYNQDWIDSVDTSNPVVAGMKGLLYDQSMGLRVKPSEKLYTMINAEVDEKEWSYIDYNIDCFRKFCNYINY